MSYVYVFHAVDCDMVKIGFSHTPWIRMQTAQANCPVILVMAAILPAENVREGDLHQRFARDRIRGEWFRVSPDIRAFLAAQPRPVKPVDGRTTRWRNQHLASSERTTRKEPQPTQEAA